MAETLKEMAVSRQDIFYVPPKKLRVKDGWNSRIATDPANQEHIEFLARSIAEVGVKEPISVFRQDDEMYVSDGHCRLAATLLAIERGAKIEAVPVKTEVRGAGEPDRLLRQVLEGKSKTPLEQAAVYAKLVGFGWTVAIIAAKAGKSLSHINSCLDLLEAPAAAQKMVADGEVSATLAGQVLREQGATKGTETLKEAADVAKKAGKTRATAKDVQKVTRSKKAPEAAARDPEAVDRLIKKLIKAARAGDERIAGWLAEAGISID